MPSSSWSASGLGSTLGGRVGVVAMLDVAGLLFITASGISLFLLPAELAAEVPLPTGSIRMADEEPTMGAEAEAR